MSNKAAAKSVRFHSTALHTGLVYYLQLRCEIRVSASRGRVAEYEVALAGIELHSNILHKPVVQDDSIEIFVRCLCSHWSSCSFGSVPTVTEVSQIVPTRICL